MSYFFLGKKERFSCHEFYFFFEENLYCIFYIYIIHFIHHIVVLCSYKDSTLNKGGNGMVLLGNTPCPTPNGMGLGEIYSGFKWGLKFFKSDVLPSLAATVGHPYFTT